MTFQNIFNEYYTLLRGDSDIPDSTDDEWKIAIQLANQSIRRWDRVDGMLWKELFQQLSNADDGDRTVITGITDYETPSDFRKPGGWVFYKDSDGNTQVKLKVIEPFESQLYTDESDYAYFTGDPNSGYTLTVNPAPASSENGYSIEYMYYKNPTYFASTETGTTTVEMSDPNFIVQDMLANRYRNMQKWPAYQTARKDADQALANMINDNVVGTHYNSWKVPDPDGGGFGG